MFNYVSISWRLVILGNFVRFSAFKFGVGRECVQSMLPD